MSLRVALIGFGEVGQILATDLAAEGVTDIVVHDRLFSDPTSRPAQAVATAPVRWVETIAAACADRDLVISAVTAGQALAVAQAAAPALGAAMFLDLNSVAPHTRLASEAAISPLGGRYVEGAIMAPIAPKRLKTPVLLGGPHAAAFAPVAQGLGFSATVFSDQVGRASAVKLSRSIFVKGLEAIITESLLSARHYGVEAEVLASLDNTIAHPDWSGLARYLITRPLTHGQRRSEEMQEAVDMLADAGLASPMARATVELQADQGALGLSVDQQADDLLDLLDEVARRKVARARRREI